MWIRNIKLINFQCHSDFECDFSNGLNIIHGASDKGKSAIRRALEWVIQNKNIDGIRKSGTKKTSVNITLDDNTEVERIRTSSVNRYVLCQNGKEITFDAVGKSIPEQIKEALNIHPIEIDGEQIYLNSSPQLALPFLFDKSPSVRMKLFNKLTGNEVLDKLFVDFNKDILRYRRDLKTKKSDIEDLSKSLEQKEIKRDTLKMRYNQVKNRIETIKEQYKEYDKLKNVQNRLVSNKKDLEGINDQLKEITLPELNFGDLKGKIEGFDRLLDQSDKLEVIYDKEKILTSDITKTYDNIFDIEDKIKEVKSNIKICPTCNREL